MATQLALTTHASWHFKSQHTIYL